MTEKQIADAAAAFSVLIETSGCSIDELHENLSGTIYSDEEFSEICAAMITQSK